MTTWRRNWLGGLFPGMGAREGGDLPRKRSKVQPHPFRWVWRMGRDFMQINSPPWLTVTFLLKGAQPFVYEWMDLGKVRKGCL